MINTLPAPMPAGNTADLHPISTSAAAADVAVTAVPDNATQPGPGPRLPLPRSEQPGAEHAPLAAHATVADRAPFRTLASASINITTQRHQHVLIRVCGRLDRVGIARLRTALTQARCVGSPQLVVDLTTVNWWDHSLARALAWVRLQLRGQDQHLVLTGATAGLLAEIDSEEIRLSYPLWRGPRPGQAGYRPETADQP